MKKISLLLLMVLAIFSACKKDRSERNAARLIGRWNVESVTYISYENGKETEKNRYEDIDLTWEFRSDGSATVNFEGGEEITNWTVVNDKLTFTRSDGQRLDFRINSLSSNNLDIVFEDEVRVVEAVTYKDAIEFNLKR